MLLRFRARNYPQTLTMPEHQQWQEFREMRLIDPNGGGSYTFDDYMLSLEQLASGNENEAEMKILQALYEYANVIGGG